jgi:hypothetical protein
MTDKGYDMYCVLTELEVSIANKIETYIDASWDSDTVRREIELMIMERKKIQNDIIR